MLLVFFAGYVCLAYGFLSVVCDCDLCVVFLEWLSVCGCYVCDVCDASSVCGCACSVCLIVCAACTLANVIGVLYEKSALCPDWCVPCDCCADTF